MSHEKHINVQVKNASPEAIAVRHGLAEILDKPVKEPHDTFDLSKRRSQRRRVDTKRDRTIKGTALGLVGAVALGMAAPAIRETPEVASKVIGGLESVAKATGSVLSIPEQTESPENKLARDNTRIIAEWNDSRNEAIKGGHPGNFELPTLKTPEDVQR